MSSRSKWVHALLPFVALALGLVLAPAHVRTANAPAMPPGLEKIEHFVFIMQENRSFDSYFGTYPGVEGLPPGICLTDPTPGAQCAAPFHDSNDVNRGGPHSWNNAHADMNNGLMDGFVAQSYQGKSNNDCKPPAPTCTPGTDPRDVMGWHDYREIPNYWSYANLYVLQDRMFESVLSYSLPAHLYMLAGQSGGYVASTGQAKPTRYDFAEITELLTSGKISWNYYVASGTTPDTEDGEVVGTPTAQQQDPLTYTLWNPLPAFPAVMNDPAQKGRLVDVSQFYSDAKNGTLPQVSWIIPSGAVSEHPPSKVSAGMEYVTGLVNAIMQGPNWKNTAIFIAWDDWGGFYDHVPPQMVDQNGLGLRVPGLLISPYARQNYVDHKTYSFESWLKIVEERFGVTPMTARDNTALDMIDSFDFTAQPRDPVVLKVTGSAYPPALQSITHPPGTVVNVLAPTGALSFAAEAIVSAYGSNLANGVQSATVLPLPTTLAGATVTVKDSGGTARQAGLFYASAAQVNYAIPAGTSIGPATVTIANSSGSSTGNIMVAPIAPALFTANLRGYGPPAANIEYLVPGGVSYQLAAQCDNAGNCTPAPIDLTVSTGPTFLILYATGIRGRSSLANVQALIGGVQAPVQYAGPQGQYAGLDQINVVVPASLKGRGRLVLTLTVDGQTANMVAVAVK
jgi:uncharacterized protein (TIGR03437 family)